MLTYVNLCLPLLTYVNRSKDIRGIRMQNLTIRKGFEAFECKFEQSERQSKLLKPNSNQSTEIRSVEIQIRTIRKGFKPFQCKNLTIRTGFEAFERD